MKPFTFVAAILLLAVAVCHAYRAYAGFDFIYGTIHIPIVASWVAAAVTAFLGLMLLMEPGK